MAKTLNIRFRENRGWDRYRLEGSYEEAIDAIERTLAGRIEIIARRVSDVAYWNRATHVITTSFEPVT